jgi:hypothetical protein
MGAYPTLLGSTAVLAVVLLSGCGAPGAMPVPSGSPSGAGIGADDEAALNSIELVAIDITIETEACNALREDCEEPEYVDVLVEAEPDGGPVTVPFRDGTLTVEYVGIVTDIDSNPVDVDLELRIIANGTQDFYGSYVDTEYYDLSVDPYLFTYDHGWTMYWPPAGDFRVLASISVEQWGGNGRHSYIDIQIRDVTPSR